MTACVSCTAETSSSQLCQGCYVRTANRLDHLQTNMLELHTAMQRMVRMIERNDVGRSAETAVYFNTRAAETIHLIRTTLVSWVRELHADIGAPLPVNTSILNLTEYLQHLLPEFRRRADAGLFVDEIQHVNEQALHVIDLPVNRTVFPVGPCPEDVEQKRCVGKVRAIVPNDHEQRPVMRCDTCLTEWHAEQWVRVGARILHRMGQLPRMDEQGARRLLDNIA